MNPVFLYKHDEQLSANIQNVVVSDPVAKKLSFLDLRAATVLGTASVNANRPDSISSSPTTGWGNCYYVIDADNPGNVYVYDLSGSLQHTTVAPNTAISVTKHGGPGSWVSNFWITYTDGVNYYSAYLNGLGASFLGPVVGFGPATSNIQVFITIPNQADVEHGLMYVAGVQPTKLLVYAEDGYGIGNPTPLATCSLNSFGFGGGFTSISESVYVGAFNGITGNPEIWVWNSVTFTTTSVWDLTFLKNNNGITTASVLTANYDPFTPSNNRVYLVDNSGVYGWDTSGNFVCSQSFLPDTASKYAAERWDAGHELFVPITKFNVSSSGGAVYYN
jgi:hypothetical protein